jgi:hypothetical protein
MFCLIFELYTIRIYGGMAGFLEVDVHNKVVIYYVHLFEGYAGVEPATYQYENTDALSI